MPSGACATRSSASSSATCVVKKLVCAYSSCRAARASPPARRDANGRGRTPPRRRTRRYSPCRSASRMTMPLPEDGGRIIVRDRAMQDVGHFRRRPLCGSDVGVEGGELMFAGFERGERVSGRDARRPTPPGIRPRRRPAPWCGRMTASRSAPDDLSSAIARQRRQLAVGDGDNARAARLRVVRASTVCRT